MFAVSSKSKNQKEVDDFGLPKGELPFVIHNVKKNHKFPASILFTAEALKEHLESFLADKLEPYVKSEPIPESQPEDGPVVVVGKNFDDIVLDPSKDVLLEAYAPWCGHCKTLEPKYKELAQKMKKYSDSLTIAKVVPSHSLLLPPSLDNYYLFETSPNIFEVFSRKTNFAQSSLICEDTKYFIYKISKTSPNICDVSTKPCRIGEVMPSNFDFSLFSSRSLICYPY